VPRPRRLLKPKKVRFEFLLHLFFLYLSSVAATKSKSRAKKVAPAKKAAPAKTTAAKAKRFFFLVLNLSCFLNFSCSRQRTHPDDEENESDEPEDDGIYETPDSEELFEWACERGEEFCDLAEKGDIEGMKKMITYVGVQPPVMTRISPLHAAVAKFKNDAVKFLLDEGADPNFGSGLSTPLHAGGYGFNMDGCKMLLERGADPRLVDNKGHNISYYLQIHMENCEWGFQPEMGMFGPPLDHWFCEEILGFCKAWKPSIPKWSPTRKAHAAYSRGFKDAIFALLCSLRRLDVHHIVAFLVCEKMGELELAAWDTFGYWPDTVEQFKVEPFDKEKDKPDQCLLM
jgi:hypothetical protein